MRSWLSNRSLKEDSIIRWNRQVVAERRNSEDGGQESHHQVVFIALDWPGAWR